MNFIKKYLTKKYSQIYVEYSLVKKDATGKILKNFSNPCQSLVANFLQGLYAYSHGLVGGAEYGFTAPYTSNKDMIKTSSVHFDLSTYYNFQGVAGNLAGIAVGSGSSVPAATDIDIDTLIAHGSGVGQLVYGLQSCGAGVTIAGNNSTVIFSRTFTNSSGGVITVDEFVIFGFSAGNRFLILRDVLPGTETLNPGQTITIEITFSITT